MKHAYALKSEIRQAIGLAKRQMRPELAKDLERILHGIYAQERKRARMNIALTTEQMTPGLADLIPTGAEKNKRKAWKKANQVPLQSSAVEGAWFGPRSSK